MPRSFWPAALLGGTLSVIVATAAMASQLREVDGFGGNPGNLQMLVYLPDQLPDGAPLVVVVHGCLQTARDVADNTGWVQLAENNDFALLFPQTSRENEPTFGCFRTWDPAHQSRGAGEPRSIERMVQWLIDNEGIDAQQIFITGMSSGGLVTNEMLAAYPELFAAGAPLAAYPYPCADDYSELAACAAGEQSPAAGTWGAMARNAHAGFTGQRPAVSIWHGDSDPVIRPVNLTLQLQQWTEVLGIDATPDAIESIGAHLRKRYLDANGVARLETWEIRGLGHAFAVDPDASPACGAVADYFADADICASLWIGRWFGIVP